MEKALREKSKMRKLRRSLKRVHSALGRMLRASGAQEVHDPAMTWLSDNRYRIEDALGALSHSLRGRTARACSPRLLSACGQALEKARREGTPLGAESLFHLLEEPAQALGERELAFLAPALSLCALSFLAAREKTICARRRAPESGEAERAAAFAVGALRAFEDVDFSALHARLSPIEQILSRDPAGAYAGMDADTRARYRIKTAALAERLGLSQTQCAEHLVALAREGTPDERKMHVGYYLFEAPPGKRRESRAGAVYAALSFLLPALLAAALGFARFGWLAGLAFPLLAEICLQLMNRVFLRLLSPKEMFSMEPDTVFPDDARTLCVVAALGTDAGSVRAQARRLGDLALAAKGGKNLCFGLLLDLKESDTPRAPSDAAILAAARGQIERLDRRFGGFYLFTRPRRRSESEQSFIPRERKRGAIEALCALLRGRESELEASRPLPRDIRFLAVLDADTQLQIDALARCAAALRHPLSRPIIRSGRVRAGHGIVQPQLVRTLPETSVFAGLYGGQAGYDGYGGAAPELYQDLLDETGFTGKGLIDVDAYLEVLHGVFPSERILSHDLLEGAYLRAGYCPRAVFFEDFPAAAAGFFLREHRWIRGDWQTAPWLAPRVRTESGARVKNPLPFSARLRIAENLRRSLLPVYTFLALVSGLVFPPALPLSALALGSLLPPLLFSPFLPREKHAYPLPGALLREAGRTALALAFLPKAALVSLDAVFRALWRMLLSGRKLLQWRTAAQSDGGAALRACMLHFIPCTAAGLALLALPGLGVPAQLLRLGLAAVWIGAPIAAFFASKDRKVPKLRPDTQMRGYLHRQAGLMYGYFRENVCEKTCFLPPDNVQLRPAQGLARRTSPTNIGLALLCFLAALELGLDGQEAVLSRLDAMLATLEGMEKWNGNLYNWYFTDTAKPMFPRRVSTVDSGNLLACLLTLGSALSSLPSEKARALAARAEKLAEEMRLAPLYDPEKKLFRIGYDRETDEFDPGCYDLLESEARLASYIAVSRGEAPLAHWQRLGRPIGAIGRRRGLLSWSGTMFEYLMPSLLLPDCPGSILAESAHFALFAQKKRAGGYPFGISESCFFAFDEEMNFQYKAHGVQALGLARGLDRETVLSPYASYLALLTDPHEGLRSLYAFDALDSHGLWGHYEALDFTPSHIPPGCAYMPVRCFMAHHVGMSLLACAHVLTEGSIRRHFLSVPALAAHTVLLKERFPVGARISERPRRAEKKTARAPSGRELIVRQGAQPGAVEGVMLSNGGIRVFASTQGVERAAGSGCELTTCAFAPWEGFGGVRLFLLADGEVHSLTPAPDFDPDTAFSVRLTAAKAEYTAQRGQECAHLSVWVSAQERAVRFSLTIESRRLKPSPAYAALVFVPVLESEQAYRAHPAFSRLFLSARERKEENALVISRRARDGGAGLCACLACAQTAQFENSRERLFSREGLSRLAHLPPRDCEGDGAPDPICACFVPVRLEAGSACTVDLALSCGADEDSALREAKLALGEGPALAAHRIDAILDALGMDAEDAAYAFSLYSRAVRPRGDAGARQAYLEKLHEGRGFLWRYGISGDFPLLAAENLGEDAADRLLRAHMLLYLCGAYCDLALVAEAGSYRRGNYAVYRDILRAFGGESLIAARAGVHLIDEALLPGEAKAQLFALADCLPAFPEPVLPQRRLRLRREGMHEVREDLPARIENGQAEFEGAPALVWSHILANESFGYLACDSGAGNLWYKNAQENRISPWVNDPLACEGPEDIELVSLFGRGSLFSRGKDCRVRFSPGFAEWETHHAGVRARLTAFVPPKLPARVFMVELSGEGAAQAALAWRLSLQLGPKREDARTVRFFPGAQTCALCADNPAAKKYGEYRFLALSWPPAQGFTCDEAAARADDYDGAFTAPCAPCMAFSIRPARDGAVCRAVLVCGCAETPEQAARICALCSPEEARKAAEQTKAYWDDLCADTAVHTPDARLDAYLDAFAPYQVIAGRLFARHSMYQSSGAYGFRDQLQDVCALLALPPNEGRYALVRAQLLRAAAHQYAEGDVQHWWHEDADTEHARGVRTRVSDDLLFLPYAALAFADAVGPDIWEMRAPWLRSQPLSAQEHERFERAAVTAQEDSLWTHCVRALSCVLERGVGTHGLARIGGGDWNDAMNAVGMKGKGESVWLSWFAALVFSRMADTAEDRGETESAVLWRQFADSLRNAALDAWDGDHFLRIWHDDGMPIGAWASDACRVDAISQAFAVFAGPPEGREAEWRERTAKALDCAVKTLYDGRLVRLFTPPFTAAPRQEPGYIKAYPPGVRENGGQYTHGAVWLALALARFGRADEGARMLSSLAPSGRDGYLAEPYYLAGDVYACGALYGRAGWTIYTGAAGWYLRAVWQALLGLRFVPGAVEIAPRLPKTWPGFSVTLAHGDFRLRIEVRRAKPAAALPVRIPWPPERSETVEIGAGE